MCALRDVQEEVENDAEGEKRASSSGEHSSASAWNLRLLAWPNQMLATLE